MSLPAEDLRQLVFALAEATGWGYRELMDMDAAEILEWAEAGRQVAEKRKAM